MAILTNVTITCANCGATFHPHSTARIRKPQRFCSHGCAYPKRERSDPAGRFWVRVDKCGGDGCWNWTGGCNAYGYGAFGVTSKDIRGAHRYAWELTTGVPLEPTQCLLHSCDNRKCVNPNHLRIGTRPENSKDMVRRNRSTRGSRAKDSKLTERDIPIIRADARLFKDIAAEYGVNPSVVSRIKARKVWRHVP